MPNVDGCILSAYQSCRIGLEGLKVHSSEIDRMLLDKFTELVSNNQAPLLNYLNPSRLYVKNQIFSFGVDEVINPSKFFKDADNEWGSFV